MLLWWAVQSFWGLPMVLMRSLTFDTAPVAVGEPSPGGWSSLLDIGTHGGWVPVGRDAQVLSVGELRDDFGVGDPIPERLT